MKVCRLRLRLACASDSIEYIFNLSIFNEHHRQRIADKNSHILEKRGRPNVLFPARRRLNAIILLNIFFRYFADTCRYFTGMYTYELHKLSLDTNKYVFCKLLTVTTNLSVLQLV